MQVLLFQYCKAQAEGGKTCTYKNGGKTYQINEGDVTEIKKTKVRVCENGKSVLKKKEEVPKPYKYGCNGEKTAYILIATTQLNSKSVRHFFSASTQPNSVYNILSTQLNVRQPNETRQKIEKD